MRHERIIPFLMLCASIWQHKVPCKEPPFAGPYASSHPYAMLKFQLQLPSFECDDDQPLVHVVISILRSRGEGPSYDVGS